jgi:hypothetical protein
MAMRNFEEKSVNPSGGRESGKMPPPRDTPAKMPNRDRNPSKEKGPVKEPKKDEPMVLMPETQNATPEKGRPITSTEKAAKKPNTSTVADGEAG